MPEARPGIPGDLQTARGGSPLALLSLSRSSWPSFWLFPGLPENPSNHFILQTHIGTIHLDTSETKGVTEEAYRLEGTSKQPTWFGIVRFLQGAMLAEAQPTGSKNCKFQKCSFSSFVKK